MFPDFVYLFQAIRSAIGIGVFMAVLCFVSFRVFGAALPEVALYACFISAALPTFFIRMSED